MEIPTQKSPEPDIIEEETTDIGVESKVVLFNDEWHSFEEVIAQIIIATNCNFHTARGLTFEVHVKGKAIVFNGEIARCIKVSGILEEIGLLTEVIT
jgi:ATP-dependent Clp protease adaptor protein ClpS